MTVQSVKYLFKYVYKGHDCASIQMCQDSRLDHDEILMHLDARYICSYICQVTLYTQFTDVSAPEAKWRLSEYNMHEQSHTIIRLSVHLPDQQPVYFQQGHEHEALDRST